jgi:hypothetical protein
VKVVPRVLKQPLALGGFVGAAFVEVTLLALYAAREGKRANKAAGATGTRARLVRVSGQVSGGGGARPAKQKADPGVIKGIERMVKLVTTLVVVGTTLSCGAYYVYGQTCHESVVLKFARAPADPAKNVTLTCGGEKVFSRAPADVVDDAFEVRVTVRVTATAKEDGDGDGDVGGSLGEG